MAYEYFLHSGCPLQQRMDPTAFMRAVKVKESLEWIDAQRQQWDGQGPHPEERTMVFQYEVETLNGARREVSVRELRETYKQRVATEAMDLCGDCPINMHRDLLGCYGAINYPITAEAEAWLLDRFDPPDGANGYIAHHIFANDITGQELDRHRPRRGEQPHGLLAAPKPLSKHLSLRGRKINSSQLIEYLLACMPEILPVTMFGLCVDFRAIQIDHADLVDANFRFSLEARLDTDSSEDVLGEFRQDLQRIPFVMRFNENDDASTAQFKAFFMSCWVGCLTGAGMAVDG